MLGPEALNMAEIAERISLAVGKTVRYVSISRDGREQALLAAGVPSFFVDALDVKRTRSRPPWPWRVIGDVPSGTRVATDDAQTDLSWINRSSLHKTQRIFPLVLS